MLHRNYIRSDKSHLHESIFETARQKLVLTFIKRPLLDNDPCLNIMALSTLNVKNILQPRTPSTQLVQKPQQVFPHRPRIWDNRPVQVVMNAKLLQSVCCHSLTNINVDCLKHVPFTWDWYGSRICIIISTRYCRLCLTSKDIHPVPVPPATIIVTRGLSIHGGVYITFQPGYAHLANLYYSTDNDRQFANVNLR